MRGGRKNTVRFGLVTIPVALPSATDSTKELRTELVAPSGQKAKQQYVDPGTGEVLERDQLRRGVKHGDGYKIVPDEAWDAITEGTKLDGSEILSLVSADALDARRDRIRDAHYVQPEPGSARALALLRRVLIERDACAVLEFAVGSRPRLGVLRVRARDGALEVVTLASASEVRSPDDEVTGIADAEVKPAELEQALMLADSLDTDEAILDEWTDEVVARRNALVERAAEGEAIEVEPSAAAPEPEGDLFDKLTASVAAVKKPTGKAKAKPRAKAKAKA